MKKIWLLVLVLSIICFSFAGESNPSSKDPVIKSSVVQVSKENPISDITQALGDRLTKNLHVKNIVGDPVKVGKLTIIPVVLIDIGYGGGEAKGQKELPLAIGGFYMGGEARPLGFIVIGPSGTKFISAGKAPRK